MNRNNMVFLKEDGSLDIDRINKLPLEEHMQMVGSMSNEQYEEFLSSIPINESKERNKTVDVNHTKEVYFLWTIFWKSLRSRKKGL